jgi:hypothetical protein
MMNVSIDPALARVIEAGNINPAAAHAMVESTVTEAQRQEWGQFRKRQSCISVAASKPLPGSSGDAFINGPVRVDKYTIYEVMPIHHLALQAIESPLLSLVSSAVESSGESAKAEFDPKDEREVCFIFTTDPEALESTPKAVRRQFIHTGADAFKNVPAAFINAICSAVIEQYRRHLQTTLRLQQQLEGQVEKGFFPAPKPSPSKQPESAGS